MTVQMFCSILERMTLSVETKKNQAWGRRLASILERHALRIRAVVGRSDRDARSIPSHAGQARPQAVQAVRRPPPTAVLGDVCAKCGKPLVLYHRCYVCHRVHGEYVWTPAPTCKREHKIGEDAISMLGCSKDAVFYPNTLDGYKLQKIRQKS